MSRMGNIAVVLNGAECCNREAELPSSYRSFYGRDESYIELNGGRHTLHWVDSQALPQ